MRQSQVLLAALVVLSACGKNAPEHGKAGGHETTLKPAASATPRPTPTQVGLTILQCDGSAAQALNSDIGPEQSESRAYRINEAKQTVELWNEATHRFRNLCEGDCVFDASPKAFSFLSTPKAGSSHGASDPGIAKIDVDRVSGKITDSYNQIVVFEKGGLQIRRAFMGECRKVDQPSETQKKF